MSSADAEHIDNYIEQESTPSAEQMLKLATAALALGKLDKAVELLRAAPEGQDKRWLLGLTFKEQKDWSHALADFERAQSRGFDEVRVLGQMADTQRLAGKLDDARKVLAELEKTAPDSAEYFYRAGQMAESDGDVQQACDMYEQAIEKDEEHVPSLFRLAFLTDLTGNEDQAIELYRECIQQDPVNVNALINLAVLYEDMGENEQAQTLLECVLRYHPNHARARLFLKDVISSEHMYYDEEFEKRKDKFQKVLDMPISDFELSVRSRNCLKKMGIKTLGDLTRITEAELLSYKNFGETSLNEIKAILTSKNLRLGQALEEQASKKAAAMLPGSEPAEAPEDTGDSILNTPIDDLNFSVRSRKCLQKLDIQTVGELANYTEAQLMAVKNFGMISLKEVKDKLGELGLELRKPEI